MRVLFGAVVCFLIDLEILVTSAQSTTTPDNLTTDSTPSTTPQFDVCTALDPPINKTIVPSKTSANLSLGIHQTNSSCIPTSIFVDCIALREENLDGWQWVISSSTATVTISNDINIVGVYIHNLSEFTNYTCNATLSDGIIKSNPEVIKFQTEEEVSGPPQNLTVTEKTDTNFTIQWKKPVKNPGVFLSYLVHIESNASNHYIPDGCTPHFHDEWSETTNETYSFFQAFPDYIYEVTVLVQNSAGNGSYSNISVVTDTAASEAPSGFGSNSILNSKENIIIQNLSWYMPCETNGKIDGFQIELEGHYVSNYSMEHSKSITVIANDSETCFAETALKPGYSYEIGIRAKGVHEDGMFLNSSFITDSNYPGPPILDGISELGPNNFTIQWKEPELKAGEIINYFVSIISLGPIYETDWNRCHIELKNWQVALPGTVLSYTFLEGNPYYRYNVSLMAATSQGNGSSSEVVVNTTSSVPNKPENLTFDVAGMVSWVTPCEINGPINGFSLMVQGNYTEGENFYKNKSFVPYVNGTFFYNYKIPLLESYVYTVTLWVTLQDGTEGSEESRSLTTPDGYPGPPIITDITNKSSTSFTVSWDHPSDKNGKIIEYQISITSLEPLYETHCFTDVSYNNNTNGNVTVFTFNEGQPYTNYSISIQAKTARGWGNSSDSVTAATEQSFPENVQNIHFNLSLPTQEEYNANVDILFDPSCTNGPLVNYKLILHGKRQNYPDDEYINTSISNSFSSVPLKPEYMYEFAIQTNTLNFNNISSLKNFTSPAGIPQFTNTNIDLKFELTTSSATISLEKEVFDVRNGNISYLAIILSEKNETGGDFSRWDPTVWPNFTRDGYYQLSKDWWNPFENSDFVQFVIGDQQSCDADQNHCNRPLESGKEYYLIIRLFSTAFYKNSPTIYFRTEDTSKLGVILGVIFGVLLFALLGFAGFFVWRKNLLKISPILFARKLSVKTPSDGNTSIPIHKFIQYCKNLENSPEKFAEQYMQLTEKSKELMTTHTTTFAELTENRRKNRYTNILPYDETRVKLLIDEDDEIGSDYINASYIRGYTGNVEYIATQGPLPSTCRDFWKMVIQENVSIIVMVTQFVEDNKEKCYKYFPNNHETMTIGDDMEVKCTMELHFGTYCVRTIQVKKDATQATVTHMQYLDWPDFNVPKGTGTMLQFCHQLRERLKLEGGYVIVHCSAGVGRTGTLIATDILIQNINAGKNIDIYNIVLDLRRQRMNMVQAQKQYVYIHSLIRDTLECQASELNDNLGPLYENQSTLQMKTDDDNLIIREKESQF